MSTPSTVKPQSASSLIAAREGAARGTLFAGLAVIGFANGIVNRAIGAFAENPIHALAGGFGISAVAWIALGAAVFLVARPDKLAVSPRDMLVTASALAAFLAPVAPLSWLALSGLGAHLVLSSRTGSPQARGGWILLALTVPMFWSNVLMAVAGRFILTIDAALVGALLTEPRVGNAISFQDGWGYFWVSPQCSSLANISIAVLGWVVCTRAVPQMRHLGFRYCAAAILAVIIINVGRMGLTGISRAHYGLTHGEAGAVFFGWLTLAAIFGIYCLGARRPPGYRHATHS